MRPGEPGAAAWLELMRRLIDVLEQGRGVPCVADPAPYTSDDRGDRDAAAAACAACPALAECARSAVVNDEPLGVWAGVDLTPRYGGSPTKVRAELAARAGEGASDLHDEGRETAAVSRLLSPEPAVALRHANRDASRHPTSTGGAA